jgi:hypothetical protein
MQTHQTGRHTHRERVGEREGERESSAEVPLVEKGVGRGFDYPKYSIARKSGPSLSPPPSLYLWACVCVGGGGGLCAGGGVWSEHYCGKERSTSGAIT